MVIDMKIVGSFALCALFIIMFVKGFSVADEESKKKKGGKGSSGSSATHTPTDTEQK